MILDSYGRPTKRIDQRHQTELARLARGVAEHIGSELVAAMRTSRDGKIQINLEVLEEALNLAFEVGRGPSLLPQRAATSMKLEEILRACAEAMMSVLAEGIKKAGKVRVDIKPILSAVEKAYEIGANE